MLPTVKLEAPPIAGPFSQYLNARETSVLVHLVGRVNPCTMIEFGCNVGRTACRVLDNVPSIETYVGIDVPTLFRPVLHCQRNEVPARAGIEASDRDNFYLLECPGGATELLENDLERCEAVFIDGCHSEYGVLADSRLARALLKPGGVIVWHDYANPGVEVTRALDQLHAQGWPLQHVEGTWLAFMH